MGVIHPRWSNYENWSYVPPDKRDWHGRMCFRGLRNADYPVQALTHDLGSPTTTIETQNDGLEEATPFNYGPFGYFIVESCTY